MVNVGGRIVVVVQGTTTQSLLRITPANRTLGASLGGITVNGSLKELIADGQPANRDRAAGTSRAGCGLGNDVSARPNPP